ALRRFAFAEQQLDHGTGREIADVTHQRGRAHAAQAGVHQHPVVPLFPDLADRSQAAVDHIYTISLLREVTGELAGPAGVIVADEGFHGGSFSGSNAFPSTTYGLVDLFLSFGRD